MKLLLAMFAALFLGALLAHLSRRHPIEREESKSELSNSAVSRSESLEGSKDLAKIPEAPLAPVIDGEVFHAEASTEFAGRFGGIPANPSSNLMEPMIDGQGKSILSKGVFTNTFADKEVSPP